MSNNLEFKEASKAFFGRHNKIAVWDAIVTHMTEPPKLVYSKGLYRYLMTEVGVEVNPVDVSRELSDFSNAGLIIETKEHGLPLPATAHVYAEAESEGWLMVNAVVGTFRLWYPEALRK